MSEPEAFLDNETAKKMMKSISPIYDRSYVAKWLFQVMGTEIEDAWNRFEELREQAFVDTATWGLKYWEWRYYIGADESNSWEERRNKIRRKQSRPLPINPKKIEKFIKDICGREAKITENIAPYVFSIAILSGESNVNYFDIKQSIERAKPAHLSFVLLFEAAIDLSIHTADLKKNFGYVLSGTTPETNTVGGYLEENLELQRDAKSFLFPYPLSGMGMAGDTDPLLFVYTLCGEEDA